MGHCRGHCRRIGMVPVSWYVTVRISITKAFHLDTKNTHGTHPVRPRRSTSQTWNIPRYKKWEDTRSIGRRRSQQLWHKLSKILAGNLFCASKRPACPHRYTEALWKEEHWKFLVVGVINTAPDGKFAHPSDGNLDLLISRKGSPFWMLRLGILYHFHKELQSPLLTYLKVKAVVIQSDQESNCLNKDGEVLSERGPWRIEVVPSLMNALSEK